MIIELTGSVGCTVTIDIGPHIASVSGLVDDYHQGLIGVIDAAVAIQARLDGLEQEARYKRSQTSEFLEEFNRANPLVNYVPRQISHNCSCEFTIDSNCPIHSK